MDELSLQVKVSKMLGMGFVLSIASLYGVGSLIALILGWRARQIILMQNGRINGLLLAWWCIVAGALGALIVMPLSLAAILKH